MLKQILPLLVLITVSAPADAQQAVKIDPALVDKYIADTFKGAPPEWRARIEPDEAQRLCSQYRGELPAADAKRLMESAQASVVYPTDGKMIGAGFPPQESCGRKVACPHHAGLSRARAVRRGAKRRER